MEKLKKGVNRFYWVLLTIAGILGGLSALMATVNALSRKIFAASFPWAEELCTYAVVVGFFLAIPYLEWRGKQLSVDLLANSLKKKPAVVRALHIFGSIVTIAICVIIVIYGWKSSMTAIETNITTFVLQWPRAVFFIIGVISFALAIISCIFNIFLDGRNFVDTNKDKPEEKPEEEITDTTELIEEGGNNS